MFKLLTNSESLINVEEKIENNLLEENTLNDVTNNLLDDRTFFNEFSKDELVKPEESLNGLQTFIQNNYMKTNHPEVSFFGIFWTEPIDI